MGGRGGGERKRVLGMFTFPNPRYRGQNREKKKEGKKKGKGR